MALGELVLSVGLISMRLGGGRLLLDLFIMTGISCITQKRKCSYPFDIRI